MTFWDFWCRHPIVGTFFLMCSTVAGLLIFGDIGGGLKAIAEALRERKDGR